MHPILFHVGAFPVRAYSLAILTAFLASSYFATWLGRRRGLPWADLYSDFWVWAALGGLLGARIWEVAFNWSYYRWEPQQIMAIWEGGLSIQGGVAGGLMAAWLYTYTRKLPLGRFLDGAVPALLLGQGIGRIFGCALNGDAYGKPTGTSFGLVHAPGTAAYEAFGPQALWPAELFEGIIDLMLMALFLRLGVNGKGAAGSRFLLYALTYSAARFGLEFLRADTSHLVGGLTAAQVGSVGVVLLAGAVLLYQGVGRPVTAGRHSASGPTEP